MATREVTERGGGDGHLVLVLPGFTVGDWSNLPLATVLRRAGVRPKRWRLGSNEGPTERILAGLDQRLHELHDREGRSVSVVGVSLGGIYARHLGREHPGKVRQVITVGTPFRFGSDAKSTLVQRTWDGRVDSFDPAFLAEMYQEEEHKRPLDVPVTSIFSRSDDVVAWKYSLNAKGTRSENIEVRGATHLGLLIHPGVHLALHDRVRQVEGTWSRFRPPTAARMWYRRAVDYDPSRAVRSEDADD